MEAVRNLNRAERRKMQYSKPMREAATEYWRAFWDDRREKISTKIAVDKLKPLIGFPRKRDPVFKMTWLGWLNFIVLQWFFVRLAYVRHVGKLTQSGFEKDRYSFGWIKGVWPLTGWWSDNRYL